MSVVHSSKKHCISISLAACYKIRNIIYTIHLTTKIDLRYAHYDDDGGGGDKYPLKHSSSGAYHLAASCCWSNSAWSATGSASGGGFSLVQSFTDWQLGQNTKGESLGADSHCVQPPQQMYFNAPCFGRAIMPIVDDEDEDEVLVLVVVEGWNCCCCSCA